MKKWTKMLIRVYWKQKQPSVKNTIFLIKELSKMSRRMKWWKVPIKSIAMANTAGLNWMHFSGPEQEFTVAVALVPSLLMNSRCTSVIRSIERAITCKQKGSLRCCAAPMWMLLFTSHNKKCKNYSNKIIFQIKNEWRQTERRAKKKKRENVIRWHCFSWTMTWRREREKHDFQLKGRMQFAEKNTNKR